MRDARRNYVVVGVFVLAMLAALIAWVAALSGFLARTDSYFIVYSNVAGLTPGAKVLFEGYRVGVIESIGPSEREGQQQFRVNVSITRGWRIPEDSVAAIKAASLLSAYAIDIEAGGSARPLSPGSEIPGREVANFVADFARVADQASAFIETLGPTVESIGERVPEVIENVRTFTVGVNETVGRVNQMLGEENRERVDRILENAEVSSRDATDLTGGLRDAQQQLNATLTRVDRLIARNEPNVDRSLIALQESLEAIASRIDTISHNLEATTRNMNEFSREIRSNPGLIIRGREAGEEPGGPR